MSLGDDEAREVPSPKCWPLGARMEAKLSAENGLVQLQVELDGKLRFSEVITERVDTLQARSFAYALLRTCDEADRRATGKRHPWRIIPDSSSAPQIGPRVTDMVLYGQGPGCDPCPAVVTGVRTVGHLSEFPNVMLTVFPRGVSPFAVGPVAYAPSPQADHWSWPS